MRRILTVLFFVLLALPAAAAPDPRAADILARAKAAMGGSAWDGVRFTRTKVHIETSGLKGPGTSFEDSRTGAFVDTYDLGGLKGASGFDGTTVWEQDGSGQVAVQGADDPRQAAINEAYRRAHAFWYPDRAPATIEYAGESPDGPRKLQVVRIVPKGGRPFDMWIDAKTFLIDRIAERNSRELRTTFFSDYRAVEGKQIPFVSRQTNGETKYDVLTNVESVTFEPDAQRTAFAPPPPPKRDFGFAGNAKATTFSFTLNNNHIYLEVRLNGRPYEFLFDTGGLNVLTPTVARELGLSVQGAIQGSGTGENSADVGFTTVDRLEVGGAWLEKQNFAVISLEGLFADLAKVEGRPVSGIVGYEVFKRFIVDLDYENSRVTLADTDGFAYRGTGVRVPLDLNERTPEVAGEIDGLPGKFSLDTGSRSSLDLAAPFVAKNNLVARYNAKYQGVTGWGVGGAARSWIVRGKRLSLGGAAVDAPVVMLAQSKKGSNSDTYLAGNVGAGVLKQFNLVWNYSGHEVFFQKNKNYGQRDVFDRAGFWVNLVDAGFDVIDVIAGAPADVAGLKPGDRIVGVNGKKAASELSLIDFRLLKMAPPGTNLILDIQRGGQILKINITLKDFV